jgi:uncharacterized iron-regulated membrane protein
MLFQVHLWSGITLGLYVLLMSTTGSVLVYSNELYRAATPPPIFSKNPGPRLTDGQLSEAARGRRGMRERLADAPDIFHDV